MNAMAHAQMQIIRSLVAHAVRMSVDEGESDAMTCDNLLEHAFDAGL